jgi:hypothetical protein
MNKHAVVEEGRESKAASHEVVRLTTLSANTDVFKAQGYSVVKAAQRVGSKKVIRLLQLPIKSSGVAEVIEQYKAHEPKPPSHNVLVEPGDPVGRQLKLSAKKWVEMPNFNDEKYQKDLERYQTDMAFSIILQGLDIPLCDAEGKELTDRDAKITMLRGLGLSSEQFEQIVADIRGLTQMSEEDKVAFFDES